MMNFSNFNRVVSQVIVNHVRKVFRLAEKSEHLSVVVKELFLRCHFATSKSFLHEFFHVVVTGASHLLCRLFKGVTGDLLGVSLRFSDILNKVSGFQIDGEIQIALGAQKTPIRYKSV